MRIDKNPYGWSLEKESQKAKPADEPTESKLGFHIIKNNAYSKQHNFAYKMYIRYSFCKNHSKLPVSTESELEEMVKQVEKDSEKDSEHSGDDGITYNYYEEDYFEFTTTMMPGTVQNNQFDLIEHPGQYPADTTGDSFGDISRFDSPVVQIPSPAVQKDNKNFEYDYHVPVEDLDLKLG